jgi:hypothetical protein
MNCNIFQVAAMGVFLVTIFRFPFYDYISIALFSNIVFHGRFSLFVFCCVHFLCLFVH